MVICGGSGYLKQSPLYSEIANICHCAGGSHSGYVQPDGSYGPRQSALMAKEWREATQTDRGTVDVLWCEGRLRDDNEGTCSVPN